MSEEPILRIYTTNWCGDCVAAKRALDRLGVPYQEVSLEEDEAAVAFVERVNDGRRSVPTLATEEHAESLSGFRPGRLAEFLRRTGLVGVPEEESTGRAW